MNNMTTKVPCNVIRDIYESKTVKDAEGNSHDTGGGGLPPAYADALYQSIRDLKPKLVVEVGMAYGMSSLAIAAGLREAGPDGRFISIDPVQSTQFKSIGRLNVERAGMGDRHQLIEQPDYFALPELLKSGTRIDFGYIDGWHTFDYTLLDFFYLDRMLNTGGIMALNDCGYRAVHRVIRFILSHRKYTEIQVGLPRDYRGRNAAVTALRTITGRNSSDRYFRKTEDWEPTWNFYAPF